jgi:hypothetical protein
MRQISVQGCPGKISVQDPCRGSLGQISVRDALARSLKQISIRSLCTRSLKEVPLRSFLYKCPARGLLATCLYEICPQALDKRCFGKPSVRDFLDRFQQISNQVYKPIEVPLQNLLEVALHKLFGRVLLLARTL